jgi:tRNA-(ms[2]io[6]A)-hydroxylase
MNASAPPSVPLVHALLLAPTPESWIERAERELDVLLVDHANCEKKAASTALALMFAYAEDLELAGQMSRLAREELRHYEQVARLLRRLGIEPRRLSPGRYAQRLRRLVARGEPAREVDLMICGAFIEARSCERFAALSRVLQGPAAAMFESLHEAEARHFELYLKLAQRRAQTADIDAAPRIAAFAALEAELIVSRDEEFRFHSGAPA